MKKGIIILGSSNSNGDTYKAASFVSQQMNYSIIDLKTKNIAELITNSKIEMMIFIL